MKYLAAFAILVIVALIVVSQSLFTVSETQFGMVIRLGQIQRVHFTPGLKLKTPFVEQVTKFDNRVLRIDVRAESMPDREQQFLEIDAYLRYEITNPRLFFVKLTNESTASSRIGNIAVSELRRVVAQLDRTDVIGGVTETQEDGTARVNPKKTPEGVDTREALTREVLAGVDRVVNSPENDFGVRIIDVQIKRADFPSTAEQSVFNRMRTERDVQAKRLRAEGEEENLTIRAAVEREVRVIAAEAEREANQLRGEGEGEAIKIFAEALEEDPEFYAFQRSLQAYKLIFDSQSTIVLSADSDLFNFLQDPAGRPTEGE